MTYLWGYTAMSIMFTFIFLYFKKSNTTVEYSKAWLIENFVIQNFMTLQISVWTSVPRKEKPYKFIWFFQKH